jgi:fumarate reductase (CoM/CoB) subunit A
MGGVRVNENCETTLPRLYAAGEVASGMDGAERIDGGPAITWCLTMGYIAGKAAAAKTKELNWLEVDRKQVGAEQEKISSLMERREGIKGFEIKYKIKDLMWEHCALVRDRRGLEEALKKIREMKANDLPNACVPSSSRIFNKGLVEALEATNMLHLSEMIVKAALMREESRGAHFRIDFPKKDKRHWLKNMVIKKKNGETVFEKISPLMDRIGPSEEENGE